jgi:tetratricopeptide (TPR) repeat protein
MAKNEAGRNDPCPCGSGKKYKKCCWGKTPAAPAADPNRSAWDRLSLSERAKIAKEVQRLDDLSNGAMDAIEAKRYDEAEKMCESLLTEYPDMIDGHDRLGKVREGQGRFQEAADHYSKALIMIEQHPEGFDPLVSAELRQRRDDSLARIKPKP